MQQQQLKQRPNVANPSSMHYFLDVHLIIN